MGFTDIDKSGFKDMINTIKDNTDKLRKSPAQRLQDKSHIYGTFYNVNMDHSTVNEGTEDIQDDIGPNSPMRYDKIKNCLMFGVNEWSANEDDSDYQGLSIDQQNVSVIPADTFRPYEGSFFSLEITDHTILYKVNKTERTMLENIPMYKIEFEPAIHSNEPEFDEIQNQIIRTYQLLVDNIGTEAKSIILDETMLDLEQLENFIDKLNNLIFQQYYDLNSKTFIHMEGDTIHYSPFVIEFLKTTQTLFHSRYNNKVMLSHELLKTRDFDYYFENSLYTKIMNKKLPTLNNYRFSVINIPETSYEYSFSSLGYYSDRDILSMDKNRVILENFDKIESLKGTDEEFEGFVFIINDYELEMETFEEIWTTFELEHIEDELTSVDTFLHNYVLTGEVDWTILTLKEIFEDPSRDNYFKLPLVLFILRYYYNNQIGKSLVGYNTLFSDKIL